MLFQTKNMCLQKVQEVMFHEINEVYVCEMKGEKRGEQTIQPYVTLWIVKQHQLAKTILEAFQQEGCEPICADYVADGNGFGFVLPYEKERPLLRYYAGETRAKTEREQIWLELVIACMGSGIPYAILHMMLTQRQMQLQQEGKITFGYFLDLRTFDAKKSEVDCANECAEILIELMNKMPKQDTMAKLLLARKLEKSGYSGFTELFRDLKISSEKKNTVNLKVRLQQKVATHADVFFRILFFLCIIVGGIAIFMLLSQMIFGEIPLLRIFQDSFQTIGTESLLQ